MGAASALSVLRDLPRLPALPVLLVWTVRYPAELLLLAPHLLAAARDKGVALKLHLHYTGGCATAALCTLDAGMW